MNKALDELNIKQLIISNNAIPSCVLIINLTFQSSLHRTNQATVVYLMNPMLDYYDPIIEIFLLKVCYI